jgi:hypothetical protein
MLVGVNWGCDVAENFLLGQPHTPLEKRLYLVDLGLGEAHLPYWSAGILDGVWGRAWLAHTIIILILYGAGSYHVALLHL